MRFPAPYSAWPPISLMSFSNGRRPPCSSNELNGGRRGSWPRRQERRRRGRATAITSPRVVVGQRSAIGSLRPANGPCDRTTSGAHVAAGVSAASSIGGHKLTAVGKAASTVRSRARCPSYGALTRRPRRSRPAGSHRRAAHRARGRGGGSSAGNSGQRRPQDDGDGDSSGCE